MALTPVPNCSPDDGGNCPVLELVEVGGRFIITDTTTNCAKGLDGIGLAAQTAEGATILDGSNGKPIELPEIPVSPFDQTFPFMPYFNAAGRLLRMEPTEEEVPLFLAMENGQFIFRDIRPITCFDQGDICGDCDNDFVAGFTLDEETGRLCLTKIPFSEFTSAVDDWSDTATVDIQGAGVIGNTYKAHVKISSDPGNFLQARPDGLYMTIPISATAGNIISLLPDGIWATSEAVYD